jgi:hypothetical protein
MIGGLLLSDKTVLRKVQNPASPTVKLVEKVAGSCESSVNIYHFAGRHIPRDGCLHIPFISLWVHIQAAPCDTPNIPGLDLNECCI